MKIGLVFKDENAKAKKLASEIAAYLKQKKCEVLSETGLAEAQYVISLGGDGTLINKVCKYASLSVPFVGINTGNLGFLTACEGHDWKNAVDVIAGKKLVVSERIMLEAKVNGEGNTFLAINELAIKGQFRVVDLDVVVDGGRLLDIYGDGVIIATQSGSTAYSLSAGGPIVDPDLDCLLVTPINPIGLPIPSVLFPTSARIEVKVKKGVDVSLVVDGQENLSLDIGDVVIVERSEKKAKFGYLDKDHFMRSLSAKFGLLDRRVG